MDEHRTEQRIRALKSGRIVFNHSSSVIDCTVRNLTDRGALLLVSSTLGIPDEFNLFFGLDNISKIAHVAWRQSEQLGVEFV